MAIPRTKVTIHLPEKIWAEVERMANAQQITRTEALRRCISTEVFRLKLEEEGAELLVRNGSDLERVRFPY